MRTELISLGSLHFKTMTLFVFLSLFLTAFTYWRKGKQEHHNQFLLLDSFVWACFVGWLVGRIVHIVLQWSEFGLNIINYIDIAAKPGMSLAAFTLASFVVLYRFANRNDWDAFEVLDFWAMALSIGMVVLAVGWLAAGINFGYPTNLPWGINFPQVFDYRHPTQIYTVLTYLAIFWSLVRVEYKYRTFKWYKAGRSSAQSGFLFAFFLIVGGVFWTLVSFLKVPQIVIFGLEIDWLLGLITSVSGLIILAVRRGRTTLHFRAKKYDSKAVFQGQTP